jgi:hypothetical protein
MTERKCFTAGCNRAALPDDIRCSDCRWAQWTLKPAAWVQRAAEHRLPARVTGGRAA